MSEVAGQIFEFIPDVDVRQSLVSDLDELHKCLQVESRKAALVLIGSIVETILFEFINESPDYRGKITNFEQRNDLTLTNLLGWSRKFGLIDENLFRLMEPIREFRNIIHPQVRRRLKIELSENLVQIGYNVMFEIITQVKRTRTKELTTLSEKKVSEIFELTVGRVPGKADISLYVPIIQKYGVELGSEIVRRSLMRGKGFEKT